MTLILQQQNSQIQRQNKAITTMYVVDIIIKKTKVELVRK